MTNYSSEDIKVVDVDKHILKNQEMYFGQSGANAEYICANIMEGALIIGAAKVQTKLIDGWHVICGSPDWFGMVDVPYKNEHRLFTGICAFPEAGVNSCRFEVMVRIFSEKAFSLAGGKVENISQKQPSDQEIENIQLKSGKWDRIIAFKFTKNV